jgi:hypothetical protein
MKTEDSKLLKSIADAVNNLTCKGEQISPADIEQIADDCVREFPDLHPEWRNAAEKLVARRLATRSRHASKVGRHIKKRYGAAFREFDLALAAADLLNVAYVNSFWESDFSKDPDSIFDMKEHVGGRAVRALLLIGMHARMVRIGSEISLLLQSGFTECARSCLRTMRLIQGGGKTDVP